MQPEEYARDIRAKLQSMKKEGAIGTARMALVGMFPRNKTCGYHSQNPWNRELLYRTLNELGSPIFDVIGLGNEEVEGSRSLVSKALYTFRRCPEEDRIAAFLYLAEVPDIPAHREIVRRMASSFTHNGGKKPDEIVPLVDDQLRKNQTEELTPLQRLIRKRQMGEAA